MKYKQGYKYQLQEYYIIDVGIKLKYHIGNSYTELTRKGNLIIFKGYAWNGASGVPDFKFFLLPSLVHDALYQLMREGHLPRHYRKEVDMLFATMSSDRLGIGGFALIIYWVLQTFAGKASTEENIRPILEVV